MTTALAPGLIRTHPVMGTMASVHVHDDVDPDVADAAIAAMWAELDRLEEMFSTFRVTSEISRINRGELHLLDASPEVLEVVDACTWLEHASHGAFRARRPGDEIVDPAGFVKGWAAELAAQCLDRAGLRNWYLSVGGDIQTRGTACDGSRWAIGIADPNADDPRVVRALVEVEGLAVATSGTAARGRHLWDGRTDQPADALASMTVVGPHLTWADAFATAAFVMGRDGVEWVANFDGYRALAITTDGELIRRDEQWGLLADQPSMA
ncbi:MAG: FAD:protein transferase [Ilumatobacteraceae bacterium]